MTAFRHISPHFTKSENCTVSVTVSGYLPFLSRHFCDSCTHKEQEEYTVPKVSFQECNGINTAANGIIKKEPFRESLK